MRINSKGQVTIPADIRERAGLLPHTDVDFAFDGSAMKIRRAATQGKGSRGARLIAALRSLGPGTITTHEIMALTRGE